MNIKQSDGIKIFTKVLTIVKKDLPKMKEDQHKDWVETCSKRLRTMLRHCQTAQNQKTVPRWWKEIFMDESALQLQDRLRGKAADAYYFGYDNDLELPWRKLVGKDGPPELGQFEPPEPDQAPTDAAVARFKDGMTRTIPEVTIEMVGKRQGKHTYCTGKHTHWRGKHGTTDLPLRVADRLDKPGIIYISLFQGDRQICGVNKALFENIGYDKGTKMMIEIGTEYASGKIQPQDKTGLYAARAEKLEKLGLNKNGRVQVQKTPTANVSKKPAVSEKKRSAPSSGSGDGAKAKSPKKQKTPLNFEGKTAAQIKRMKSAQKAWDEAGFETSAEEEEEEEEDDEEETDEEEDEGEDGDHAEEEEEEDEDQLEKPWYYTYMDIPYPGEQTCEYCKTNFIIGNCGLEYKGRGYCYECAAFKRKAKATVWFKGRYYPKAYKDVVEEWPIWEKRSEDDRRRKEQEGRSRTRGG